MVMKMITRLDKRVSELNENFNKETKKIIKNKKIEMKNTLEEATED